MRYYVEINGESSLNIQGLMIQSLPSISKPLMRSKQETIDGRDGDIVTKLGYSAYDKTLKIGLWGNYDINEVIAFFNQEGTITFSNEPDKYYRFTILNREDYVSQLDKFRTCTIALHCQPYKYKLNEQPVEIENEYVEQEGTSLSFENTLDAPINIDLKGNTSQDGTPTPSSPIPINNVSGDNDIVECGKNIFDKSTIIEGQYIDASGNFVNDANNFISSIIGIDNTKTYYASQNEGGTIRIAYYDSTQTFISRQLVSANESQLTIPNNTKYVRLSCYNNSLNTLQLELGTSKTTYEAYNGTTYNIDLPVENLFDKDNANVLNAYINSTGTITSEANNRAIYIPCKPNTTYTISKTITQRFRVGTYSSTPQIDSTTSNYGGNYTDASITITSGANDIYLAVWLYNGGLDTKTYQEVIDSLQIEVGSKVNTYTPYGTTPIELNKIGTYQDYFYKENNTWYLHKEIGKIVFTNQSEWSQESLGGGVIRYRNNSYQNLFLAPPNNDTPAQALSNIGIVSATDTATGTGLGIALHPIGNFYTKQAGYDDIATIGITFYGILATPTNIEITYTPLINQLDNLQNAMSKEGTTNVNQVNNDLPFIINAKVLSGTDSITLTNEGNTTSKPIMTIYGKGTIGVYLSDTQIFNINLGDEEYITLDTANMEAYKVGVLKNRLVSGDYNSFKLESGNNTLTFTGIVEKVVIENYSRWI